MLQNIFSHKPLLYDLFNKAEMRALPPRCFGFDFVSFLIPWENVIDPFCAIDKQALKDKDLD